MLAAVNDVSHCWLCLYS